MSYLYLAAAFIMNSAGAILIKIHAMRGFEYKGGIWHIVVKNAYFIGALSLFAINLVFYAFALRHLPLSIAYPAMVVASFILVNGFSFFYFKESITAVQLAGYAFILVGIYLVIFFSKS